MDRRFLWVGVFAVVVLFTASACAVAVEGGLAGVKLDQPAVELLKQPMLGPPHFIGPAGTTAGLASGQVRAAGAGRVQPSVARAPARPASPFFGTGVARPTPTAAAAPVVPGGARAAPTGQMIYWLYRRGAESLVVGILADGTVASVQVTGGGSSRTSRGVVVGSTYQGVMGAYGFPDETLNYGTLLVVRYLDTGLTLTLQNMRVSSILLEVTPSALAAPRAPVRPGVRRVVEEEEDDDDDDDDDE